MTVVTLTPSNYTINSFKVLRLAPHVFNFYLFFFIPVFPTLQCGGVKILCGVSRVLLASHLPTAQLPESLSVPAPLYPTAQLQVSLSVQPPQYPTAQLPSVPPPLYPTAQLKESLSDLTAQLPESLSGLQS